MSCLFLDPPDVLRHNEDVFSRLSKHSIDIQGRGGEAILVPVSALVKTQPEEGGGGITNKTQDQWGEPLQDDSFTLFLLRDWIPAETLTKYV